MTPQQAQTFTQLWNEGATYREAAEVLGRSTATLEAWRRDLGLAPRDPHTRTFWTPERIERLRSMCKGNMSASAIARHFGKGVTRNSVLGKMHRLGLTNSPEAGYEGARVMNTIRARIARASQPAKVTRTSGNTRTIVVPVVPMPTFDADTVPATARPFLDAPRGTCRWPIGERGAVMLCCGPVERGSYCAGHGARAYAGFPARAERKPAAPKPRSFAEWEGVV